MIMESIASFFVGIGFRVLFNIKGKRLIASGIGAGMSWFVYKLVLQYSGLDIMAYFVSAICFTIYCELYEIIYETPSTTISVCCLIPLVPGYGVYKTMYQFVIGNNLKALELGINTLAIAGALALGVICVSSIFEKVKVQKTVKRIVKVRCKNSLIKKNINLVQ